MDRLKQAKRIGILGGAFNPIHYGHLTAAECVKAELDLDMILFIPTGLPPHKKDILFSEHRYLMTVLAAVDNPDFYITRMELDRPGFSYTADTLRILKGKTDAELFFIIGADEMLQLSSWKDAEDLPNLCNWVGITRPGYTAKNSVNIPGLYISGTELRERIKSEKPVKYLIPPATDQYIRDLGLYQDQEDCFIYIHKKVKERLSEYRYSHTLGVIETSVILAARFGVNLRKAHLAALLHDYAKEFSEMEKHSLCREFSIPLDPIQEANINLMHGPLSAEFAKQEFNLEDKDIIAAITYHTTGRIGMSPLEKIIKIADNIEPGRTDFPGLKEIREMSLYSLEDATAASIKRDIQYTKEKGRTIHPWGEEALNYLER